MPSACSSDTATAGVCSGPHKEICMSSSLHRTGMLLGLVLVLWGGLSWGQLPPTNDTSDGRLNTGGGSDALASTTTGAANTAYGAFALTSNTTGRANTAYRFNALLNTTTSADNIAIGALAGNQLISGNGNIYIGNPGGIASESGIIRLGANQTATYIAGIAGTGVRVGTPVFIANSG